MAATSSQRMGVVGAGIAGLAAAHALEREVPGVNLEIFERSARVGGLVETERTEEGFVIEHGPDSLVTHDTAGVDLARELGLEERFSTNTSVPRRAFLARGSELLPLPPNLLAMSPSTALSLIASPHLSVRGKLRFLMEPLVPRRRGQGDESVAAFFARRCGAELAKTLVEPMLRGIYGTPTDHLSMHAAMPRLAGLERSAGSIALGVALARLRRPHRLPGAITFRSGMSELSDALAARLRSRIRLNTGVEAVRRGDRDILRLQTTGGAIHEVDGLVLALPAWRAAQILRPLDEELAALLDEIEYAPHFSMSLAWPAEQVPNPMRGTGFLVPRNEGRFITACTWASQKWPERAPQGWALLRVFADDAGLEDEEATQRVRGELRDLMGIEAAPSLIRIRRHPKLMPSRHVGHLDLVARIERRAAAVGRIALAGNALGTIGLPACIANGIEAARKVRTGSRASPRLAG